MGEVLLYVLSFALSIAVTAIIVRRDLARLQGEELARCWPDASLWAAVVIFGPLSLPIHFLRTRRSFAGADMGLLALLVALVATSVPVELLALAFDIRH